MENTGMRKVLFKELIPLPHRGHPATQRKLYLSHTCSAVLRTRKLSVMLIGQLNRKKNWQRQRVQYIRDFWRRKRKKQKKETKKKNVTVRADSIKGWSLPAVVRGRVKGWGKGHGRRRGSIDAPKL